MLKFRSFQVRLTFFIISLLIFSLTATLITVNKISIDNTRQQIDSSLQVSADVFQNQLTDIQEKLFEIARLLSNDFAFKSAYSTNDHDTILSAMGNHLARLSGNSIMALVSLENRIIAHTLSPELKGNINPWSFLQSMAEENEYGEATSMVLVKNSPYQMMVVPLLIPDLDSWIYIGFPIDDLFVQRIKKMTRTEVTIFYKTKDSTGIAGTTVERSNIDFNQLVEKTKNQTYNKNMDGNEYVSLNIELVNRENLVITAVLQRSLDEALAGYRTLRNLLLIIFTLSLFTSIFLAIFIARQVTQPVKELTRGAEYIQNGHYDQAIDISLDDEIGVLADSFNNMAKSLSEKEKIRNLLGKVVSPAIAEELLNKGIDLGGEERFVTTLFSDVRNFTALCEGRKPEDILTLLNEYFTQISGKIENHGGVVDKYIGDAVMAIFGAPLQHHDDALRSLDAAFEICNALKELNMDFRKRGINPLSIGIGINSDIVVAGNMGSLNRLNYTVIGDGVNLASRLEGLTKNYGVDIIVSETTAHAAPEYVYRELDRVRVKGKEKACTIYEPLGTEKNISHELLEELKFYNTALQSYRTQDWKSAAKQFTLLQDEFPDRQLYKVYMERIKRLNKNQPKDNWDGIYTFTSK